MRKAFCEAKNTKPGFLAEIRAWLVCRGRLAMWPGSAPPGEFWYSDKTMLDDMGG
jgi:hypothetical protein